MMLLGCDTHFPARCCFVGEHCPCERALELLVVSSSVIRTKFAFNHAPIRQH